MLFHWFICFLSPRCTIPRSVLISFHFLLIILYECLAIDSYDLICSETYSYNAHSVRILNKFLYTLKYLSVFFKIASFGWLINLELEVGKYSYSVSTVPCDGDIVVSGFCQKAFSRRVDNTWYLNFFMADFILRNPHEFEGKIKIVSQYHDTKGLYT